MPAGFLQLALAPHAEGEGAPARQVEDEDAPAFGVGDVDAALRAATASGLPKLASASSPASDRRSQAGRDVVAQAGRVAQRGLVPVARLVRRRRPHGVHRLAAGGAGAARSRRSQAPTDSSMPDASRHAAAASTGACTCASAGLAHAGMPSRRRFSRVPPGAARHVPCNGAPSRPSHASRTRPLRPHPCAVASPLLLGTLPIVGAARGHRAWMALARPAAQAQFLFVAMAFGSLMASFARDDFSLVNVASNSNTELPMAYRSRPPGAATKARCCCGC